MALCVALARYLAEVLSDLISQNKTHENVESTVTDLNSLLWTFKAGALEGSV